MKDRQINDKTVFFIIFFCACALFFVKIPILLSDPFFFGGDSALRMSHANEIVFGSGNRVWLPLLQTHIFFFYKTGMPYGSFKFIPASYFFISVLFLGLITYRILGSRRYETVIFSVFLMFCFAFNGAIASLSVRMYQEILEIALFYMLIYLGALELKKRWYIVAIAAAGLLARETFWIYLLAITALNYKTIIENRLYKKSFVFLWAIPASWLIFTLIRKVALTGRWPEWPFGWPLMMERDVLACGFSSFFSLFKSMMINRIPVFILGGLFLYLLVVLARHNRHVFIYKESDFEKKFKPFSILSLGVIYLAIIVFDPSQCTYGDSRMGVPALSHIFIWAAIFYRMALYAPPLFRSAAKSVIIVTLSVASLLSFHIGDRILSKKYPDAKNFYSKIDAASSEIGIGRDTNVCVVMRKGWSSDSIFIGPLLYMKKRFVPESGEGINFNEYDILISPWDYSQVNVGFRKHYEGFIEGNKYAIYIKGR